MSEELPVAETASANTGDVNESPLWTDDISAEDRGFVENKGWGSPGDLLQSYRHLERLVGSDTVRIPGAESSSEEVAEFWGRLGRPDGPDEYELWAPSDMETYSDDMAYWFRDTAYECNMPLEMAQKFHDKYIEKFMAEFSGMQTMMVAQQEQATVDLQTAWGTAFEQKRHLADRAVRALGGDRLVEELRVSGLSVSVALAEAFAAAGERLFSEDSYVEARGGNLFGYSPDTARQEIQRLRADADFMNIYGDRRHPEHDTAQQRMDQLYSIAREEG